MIISMVSAFRDWPGNACGVIRTIASTMRGCRRAAARLPIGGCDFPADPKLNALHAPVFWLPSAAPAAVQLIAELPDVGLTSTLSPDLRADRKTDADGLSWVRLHHGAGLVGELDRERPIGILIPLDGDWVVRLAAADRLYRQIAGRDPDSPITAQQRDRLKRALRTIDARTSGASYRAIASAFFGTDRVAAEPWKTSSLKAQVARLAAHGRKMIEHGYRRLLRGSLR